MSWASRPRWEEAPASRARARRDRRRALGPAASCWSAVALCRPPVATPAHARGAKRGQYRAAGEHPYPREAGAHLWALRTRPGLIQGRDRLGQPDAGVDRLGHVLAAMHAAHVYRGAPRALVGEGN